MDREALVYADLNGQTHLVGRLWARSRKNRESATFEYEAGWLGHPARFSLEPALKLGPGPFHNDSRCADVWSNRRLCAGPVGPDPHETDGAAAGRTGRPRASNPVGDGLCYLLMMRSGKAHCGLLNTREVRPFEKMPTSVFHP